MHRTRFSIVLTLFFACSGEIEPFQTPDKTQGSAENTGDTQPEPSPEPDPPDTSANDDTDDSATDTASPFSTHWIIDNYANVSDEHAYNLVQQAIAGLGFDSSDTKRPLDTDRYFVGRYYVAWIDQTGFYGKINGLWQLNGENGDALNFVWFDTGRPLNMLIIGENGDGSFPAGYPGSEHVEFPNRTPEANDDPGCAQGDWCNQYAHEEAADFDTAIPWWSACNGGTVDWNTLLSPVAEENLSNGLKLVWEGPLVKEADGDGNYDGDACHEDWLFEDGVRRPVYLRAGYRLYGDQNYVDRIYQFRNAEGNPDFNGPMGIIGGYVLTKWPNPHPVKSFDSWFQPQNTTFTDTNHNIVLNAGVWNDHRGTSTMGDEVFGWIGQPFSFAALPASVAGRSITLSHIGPSDNDDVGICLCRVHGAIEMGGGLLHGNTSLPIAGGQTSIEAVRRIDFGGALAPKQEHVYPAAALEHGTGEVVQGGWAANTAEDEAGHLIYGPYATDWLGEAGEAVFNLVIDINSGNLDRVLTLDVFDVTAGEILASRDIIRTDFTAPLTVQGFRLGFDLRNRVGHSMETRVYWHENSAIRVESVEVTTWESP